MRERERDSKRGTQCIFLFPSRSGKRRGTGLRMGGEKEGEKREKMDKREGRKGRETGIRA